MAFFKHPKLDQKLIRHYLLRAIFYVQFLRLKRRLNYSFRLSPLYLFSCRRYPVYMIIRILSKIHGKAKLVGEHLYTAITYLSYQGAFLQFSYILSYYGCYRCMKTRIFFRKEFMNGKYINKS